MFAPKGHMRLPFIFRPQFILFYADEASLGSGYSGDSPPAESSDSTAQPAVNETFGAPAGEPTSDVTVPSETETQAEPDIFDGIPSLEQLQTEAEQRVPYSEGLLRLRTELERIKPEVKQFDSWKPVVEQFSDPAKVQERLTAHDSLFSPKLVDGQPVLDERNLPQTTMHPFLQTMEAKRPGYAMETLLDVMDYSATNPTTGQPEPLIGQFFREVLGLDVGRLQQYQNIDALIAKTNGSITPEDLEAAIPETLDKSHLADRELFKQLPPMLRDDWKHLDDETRRFYLNDAKERAVNREFRESQIQAQQKAATDQRQNFEAQVQQEFVQDLSKVRETAFSSLRDNLARVWQPSTDDAINQDRYDDVLAPLTLLIDPDLQPMALKRLEREGIKVNATEFNQNMSALVGARQTYVRAKAYGDGLAAERAELDFNRLQTQLMAKFNTIALQRAEKYGMQAKQIADKKGELLTTASQVRPTVPGSTAPQTFNASGLPVGMDPRSDEAVMYQWNQSLGRT